MGWSKVYFIACGHIRAQFKGILRQKIDEFKLIAAWFTTKNKPDGTFATFENPPLRNRSRHRKNRFIRPQKPSLSVPKTKSSRILSIHMTTPGLSSEPF